MLEHVLAEADAELFGTCLEGAGKGCPIITTGGTGSQCTGTILIVFYQLLLFSPPLSSHFFLANSGAFSAVGLVFFSTSRFRNRYCSFVFFFRIIRRTRIN
jgi:hypothetical protein